MPAIECKKCMTKVLQANIILYLAKKKGKVLNYQVIRETEKCYVYTLVF